MRMVWFLGTIGRSREGPRLLLLSPTALCRPYRCREGPQPSSNRLRSRRLSVAGVAGLRWAARIRTVPPGAPQGRDASAGGLITQGAEARADRTAPGNQENVTREARLIRPLEPD